MRPARGHRIDRLGDDVVLKDPFEEIEDVVHDDVDVVGVPQGQDVVGEVRFAPERRRKEEVSAGREVVDDLEHGSAFVPRPRLSRDDGHGARHVPGRLS